MAHAVHAAHGSPAAEAGAAARSQPSWPLRALSVVSCWGRTFGVFGNEMGDGVYFLGREVDGSGTPVNA
jgi:hypothetical protein